MKSKLSRRKFLVSAAASVVPAAVAHARPYLARVLNPASAAALPQTAAGDWKNAGVLDLSRTPFAKLKTVPIRAVVINDGFWSKRRATNIDSSIPSMHDELLAHGRMDNFLRLEGKSSAPQRGPVYSDSDIYKWTEAVGFALQSGDRPQLRAATTTMIQEIVATQEPSGYLNTYYQGDRKPLRMQYDTQTTGHELYCIGHMLQGAIAVYRATGDRALLDAGIRFIDDFLMPNYGPGANQKGIVAGHPEIEMALVELYRTTGNHAYVDLAGYILQGDPRIPLRPQQITYMFCGIPFTSRTRFAGAHAVRAMYACCGATDYYLETGDPAYWKTLNLLWNDLVGDEMYVTGGVGARETGEAFGDPYELPNARAYGESCAAIGVMMWNWRMLAASGDARFADVMERSLYNGINSGMSLDGRTYCYRNPLAFDPAGDSTDRHLTEGKIRNPWYDTTCCPPNLERTFASLPGYFYSTAEDGVYVHLYDNSTFNWQLDGRPFRIVQTTRYPWEGDVKLEVTPDEPGEFTLYLRIPGWSQRNSVRVNGTPVPGALPGAYLPIRRRWSAGDTVDLSFDMSTHLLKANPAVNDDRGRVAFQRGPIVFCMEHLDQPEAAEGSNLVGYVARLDAPTSAHYEEALLDGVLVLEHPGSLRQIPAGTTLYYPAAENQQVTELPTTLRLIPYYAWANRAPSAMQVWVPYRSA